VTGASFPLLELVQHHNHTQKKIYPVLFECKDHQMKFFLVSCFLGFHFLCLGSRLSCTERTIERVRRQLLGSDWNDDIEGAPTHYY
jgi:hypothetical protein